MISKSQLGVLQQSLIESVLTGQPLPGLEGPVRLPDIEWVLRAPEVLLSDEDLVGSPSVGSPPRPIRIVSANTVPRGTAYLKLSHAERADGSVILRLGVRLATSEGSKATGLSSVMITFKDDGGQWVAIDGPTMLAE